ncbi:hypothetical protein FS837_009858 [Tulasnella sp. UAMH 9824]|nr:hypothetical protein FS837_009858 [Tulasnella sp. UAMH 9824]
MTEAVSLEDLDPNIAETLKSLHIEDGQGGLSEADIQAGIQKRDALNRWQTESLTTLEVIRARILSEDQPTPPPETADVIANVARFDGEDDFLLPELRTISRDILSRISPLPDATRRETATLVLSTHIKPLFLPTQHPMVNQETGRRLPVHEGSRKVYPEFNDDQVWKAEGRGCWNTLRWTVNQLQRDDLESLWPMLIPPLMTLLDDHQTQFRIKGIQVLRELLERVDAKLLERTGIASLFSTRLIELTTEVGSRERFDRLCECLSTGVVGGVWIFAGEKLDAMEASIETLLPLVDALKVGCCRYLKVRFIFELKMRLMDVHQFKALVPQLTEVLAPKPFRPHSIRLIKLSADCLVRIIFVCEPRMHAWKDVILDALLRSWVWTKEDAKPEEPGKDILVLTEHYRWLTSSAGLAEVQANLRRLCKALADACPSLYADDFPTLLKSDSNVLSDLIPVNDQ